jgi:glutamate synthase domain-containing protein 2
MARPVDYLCIGFSCNKCIEECPEGALSLEVSPITGVIGDKRWTPDLLISSWYMAETGQIPPGDIEYRTGDSGGGFDKIRFSFIKDRPENLDQTDFSTRIPLNRLNDGRDDIELGIPVYGGGMSYGSISLHAMIARARAWQVWDSFTCTGEGGYPEELKPYDDHVITQVATGLFGVREETIQRVRIVEFKYAQGAKPGLGGHLLGDKVTVDVARMREAVPGSSLFSPFPFHSVYSVEDHKKHIDWIKEMNPHALVSVKVSTPTDVDMVAVGSYYAGAHIIHLDGSYGGTGAAPEIAKKNIAMPIEYAIVKVHNFLKEEGIRDKITVIASGGIRTADDVAKSIALGADGVVIGTAEMVALGCIRCGNCESGRGCARGIATTDPELTQLIDVDWGTQRLINLFAAWRSRLVEILYRLGIRDIRELVGRTDCLRHLDYEDVSR